MEIPWYVNVILGFLIGSYLTAFVPAYRNIFTKIMKGLAKSKKEEDEEKDK